MVTPAAPTSGDSAPEWVLLNVLVNQWLRLAMPR